MTSGDERQTRTAEDHFRHRTNLYNIGQKRFNTLQHATTQFKRGQTRKKLRKEHFMTQENNLDQSTRTRTIDNIRGQTKKTDIQKRTRGQTITKENTRGRTRTTQHMTAFGKHIDNKGQFTTNTNKKEDGRGQTRGQEMTRTSATDDKIVPTGTNEDNRGQKRTI